MTLVSEISARQFGNQMISTHAYTPASVNVGDKVRVTYGGKTIFTEVISVRINQAPSRMVWVIGVKDIQASLYVDKNFRGGVYYGVNVQILKVRHTVTSISDYMDAIDTVSFAGLF